MASLAISRCNVVCCGLVSYATVFGHLVTDVGTTRQKLWRSQSQQDPKMESNGIREMILWCCLLHSIDILSIHVFHHRRNDWICNIVILIFILNWNLQYSTIASDFARYSGLTLGSHCLVRWRRRCGTNTTYMMFLERMSNACSLKHGLVGVNVVCNHIALPLTHTHKISQIWHAF